MVPKQTRNQILAEGYQTILDQRRRITDDETLRAVIDETIYDTERKLSQSSFDTSAVIHELDRTRWARLQNTQFVHWSPNQGHPKIRHNNETDSYLVEHSHSGTHKLDVSLFDYLASIEHDLFDTRSKEQEVVVFWRGANLWNLIGEVEDSKFVFRIDYCMCYRYGDDVHTEPLHVTSTLSDFQSSPWRYVGSEIHRWPSV